MRGMAEALIGMAAPLPRGSTSASACCCVLVRGKGNMSPASARAEARRNAPRAPRRSSSAAA